MDSVDNITKRKRVALCRSLSHESFDSLESNTSTRSMMDLSTHFKSDELMRLKNDNDSLKQELLSAHAEIETLHLEYSSLKKIVDEFRQRNEQLKDMYVTSMSLKRGDCIGSSRKSFRSNVSVRRLNLDTEICTPKSHNNISVKSSSPVVNKILVSKPSTSKKESNDSHVKPQKVVKSQVTQKVSSVNKKSKPEMIHKNFNSKPREDFATRCRVKASKKGQIILLADNQGHGIVESILQNNNKLIIKDYSVIGFKKTDATTSEVLAYCNTLSKSVSKDDNIVIMTGSNDSNPHTLLSELKAALNLLKSSNVFVVNVLHNEFIKERKLNNKLKLLTSSFDNCVFIETSDKLCVAQQIIQHINTVQYKNTFLTFEKRSPQGYSNKRSKSSQKIKNNKTFKLFKPKNNKLITDYFQPVLMNHSSLSIKPTNNTTKRLITDYFRQETMKRSSSLQINKQNDFFRS